jgi:phosphatidylserine/phosphatidylglycerophosphate/cardiolipin synthase-like enzyme
VKLIVEPADGVGPLLALIKSAKHSVDIAIFRFDRNDIEAALKAAAERGVKVTALIAFANRGGEQRLRRLELRFLAAGIIVARTSDDLVRYHGKYIVVDGAVLCVLSFNFTHLDIERSRGFGIVTTEAPMVREAARLFRADCTRTKYSPKSDAFVVSPANSRRALDAFLKGARKQLLIYDPRIADKEMLRTLQARAKTGVEIKVIGSIAGRTAIDVQKLAGTRLHTRTIIRDRRQAFVGSQSLRTAELDARRELGVIVQDARIVKLLTATFESDWAHTVAKRAPVRPDAAVAPADAPPPASARDTAKAVQAFTKELDPLSITVKRAVRKAVAKAGEDLLHDKDVKDTMKKVVKKAVKQAVKEAVADAQAAQDVKDAASQP